MIYYRDRNGDLICSANSIIEMAEKSGLTTKQVRGRLNQRARRDRDCCGVQKANGPYFERDDSTWNDKKDAQNLFLKLYFAGKSQDEIREKMQIRESTLRNYYKTLVGVDITPARQLSGKDPKTVRDGFWEKWDEARKLLLESGADLDIPITPVACKPVP